MKNVLDNNVTAQAFEASVEGGRWFQEFWVYRHQSFNTLADGLVKAILEALPSKAVSSFNELELYLRILVDNIDLPDSKGAGLISAISESDLACYQGAFKQSLSIHKLQHCRAWLIANCPVFGFGVQTTEEFQALLINSSIPMNALNKSRLEHIKYQALQGALVTKALLPKGPLDPNFGLTL